MSAQPTHDITVKIGEYQDRNGDTKGRWLRIGTVFRHDDGGTSIKLDAMPVGVPEWDGWCSVFKREQRDQQGQGQGQGQPRGNNGQGQNQPRNNQSQGYSSNRRQYAEGPPNDSQMPFDDDIPF
jgi:hypothetical protein